MPKSSRRNAKRTASAPPQPPPPRAAVPQRKRVVIDQELARLCRKHGYLSKRLVLESARKLNAPLHPYFEWDNGVAGERFRLEQARRMIETSRYLDLLKTVRAQGIKTITTPIDVRTYLPGRRERGEARFKMRNQVLSDADDRAATIEQAKAQLRAWCDAWPDIHELNYLRTLIQNALNQDVLAGTKVS